MYMDRLKPVQVWLVGDTVVDRQTRSRPDRSSLAVAKEKREVASVWFFAELHADMEKLGIRHIGRPLSMGSFPLLPGCIIIIRDRGCAGCTHYQGSSNPRRDCTLVLGGAELALSGLTEGQPGRCYEV